ncbi:MAG: phage holin family protein [Patescibacteria group bacterium]|nr:phage holin family protein [Patescibacteria group bacterium]MDE2015092.1 phage holin family protein [Patescibacteria group bacterium]MDE2226520.1 phage holin family protein [Patescibacteria group bacterium]
MKFLAKIFLVIAANAGAIWAAATYVPGFHFSGSTIELLELALILMALNLILKPIVKLLLGPIIVLTLGIGLIVVNALMLYILDIFSKSITIETIPALVYGTLIVSVINFIVHLAT